MIAFTPYNGFSESGSLGVLWNVSKADAEHAALQASFEVMDTSFLLRIESSKADAGQAATQHSSPKVDDASSVSLWLSFATHPAHTGSSKCVTKAGVEHAAPESESPAIEDFAKLVKTGTGSSVTPNRKLVVG